MDGIFSAGTLWLPLAGALLLALTCVAGIRVGARWAATRRLRAASRAPSRAGAARAFSYDGNRRSDASDPAHRFHSNRSSPAERLDHQGRLPPSRRSGIPATLGRYELLEQIGAGAMGQVFLGRDPKINRKVAIKAVDLAEACDADDVQETSGRFMREAEAAGRLNHPNIVTVYDVGEEDGVANIAMEYIQGKRHSDFATR
jgi:hypothetical protein